MINTNNEKIKEILEEIHEGMNRKTKRTTKSEDDIILENRMLAILHRDIDMGPTKCAEILNEEFGYSLTGDNMVTVFRRLKIANPIERRELLLWAENLSDIFAMAITGDSEAYKEFNEIRKKPALKTGRRPMLQERLTVVTIYQRHPEINIYNDWEKLNNLGNVLAKYFFYDMCDAVANAYGYAIPHNDSGKIKKSEGSNNTMNAEQAGRKIEYLENVLERTNNMLSELQSEFDQQIEEAKTRELAEFFSQLNSEKYGCILDELFSVKRGMGRLKTSSYELPVEINGLLIMVKKLIQFVRDSHIEPVMKVNEVKKVCASDIEFCIYEGTPFKSKNDEKKVKVVSPGWVIKDKEVLISRPRVKEEGVR